MRAFKFARCDLSVCVAALLLSACGGSSMPIQASRDALGATTSKNSRTFKYTHKKQSFVVPPGVTQLTVVALGGEGGARPRLLPKHGHAGVPGASLRDYSGAPTPKARRLCRRLRCTWRIQRRRYGRKPRRWRIGRSLTWRCANGPSHRRRRWRRRRRSDRYLRHRLWR